VFSYKLNCSFKICYIENLRVERVMMAREKEHAAINAGEPLFRNMLQGWSSWRVAAISGKWRSSPGKNRKCVSLYGG
jgi:hypothetical protein